MKENKLCPLQGLINYLYRNCALTKNSTAFTIFQSDSMQYHKKTNTYYIKNITTEGYLEKTDEYLETTEYDTFSRHLLKNLVKI